MADFLSFFFFVASLEIRIVYLFNAYSVSLNCIEREVLQVWYVCSGDSRMSNKWSVQNCAYLVKLFGRCYFVPIHFTLISLPKAVLTVLLSGLYSYRWPWIINIYLYKLLLPRNANVFISIFTNWFEGRKQQTPHFKYHSGWRKGEAEIWELPFQTN